MEDKNQHAEMISLLKENNLMLKKIRRSARIAFIFRLLWIVIIIGGPLIIYWYFIEPLLATWPFVGGEAGMLESQLQLFQEYIQQFQ